jgi:hypothetical protein
MKPLFIPIFALLTVTVCADQYVFPPVHYSTVLVREGVTREGVTNGGIPSSLESSSIVTQVLPVPSAMEKPAEPPVVLSHLPHFSQLSHLSQLPQPLERLAPLLPPQAEELVPATIRGQTRTVDELPRILASAPPLAKGAVEEGTIDSKLIEPLDPSELDSDIFAKDPWKNPVSAGGSAQGTKTADPAGYALLVFAAIITTLGLIYMVFVAYDYRQRWLQSLTAQNDRYLGSGALDMGTEDTYDIYRDAYGGSLSFSEGFGLTRRSI